MRALTLFLATVCVYLALSLSQGCSDIQSSLEWVTWKVVAALAVVMSISMCIIGIVTIIRTFGPHPRRRAESGAVASMSRLAEPLGAGDRVPPKTLVLYVMGAVALVAGALAFVSLAPKDTSWPDSLNIERAGAVALAIGFSGVPWLVLVWLLQRHFALLCTRRQVPALKDLRKLWDLLNAIVLAFSVFVVFALVTTGALRNAYFAGAKDPALDKQGAEFPSSNVLVYGAYFAILLLLIALPMVNAYRNAARDRVKESCPLPTNGAVPDEDWKSEVDRLEALLHLDVGVLRSPITALTIFTPLVTAALAAFVPEIAG